MLVDPLRIAAQALLAAVFLVAGVAKLRDRRSFEGVVAGFGVAPPLASRLAAVVPVAEVAVGVGLLVPGLAPVPAYAALGLLVIFSGAVALSRGRGPVEDCGCFGSLAHGSTGTRLLVRNGVLAGVAAAVAAAGPARHSAAIVVAILSLAALALLATLERRRTGATADELVVVPADVHVSEVDLSRRRVLRLAVAGGAVGVLTYATGLEPAFAAGSAPTTVRVCSGCFCCARDVNKRCVSWCCSECSNGFVGGGTVESASGRAQGSFFGTKWVLPGKRQFALGGLAWSDPAWKGSGLQLVSTRITSYRRVPGSQLRELRGLATANGQGKYAFVLRALDGGAPGSTSDTISLVVSGLPAGGAGGSSGDYNVDGHLAAGDVTSAFQAALVK
jgi:uncharacterized membrane protein YphA (DoxX/SURF4 family)